MGKWTLVLLLLLLGCNPPAPAEVPPDDWQFVAGNPTQWVQTHKMKVPGGWLYRERLSLQNGQSVSVSVALCFVPDVAPERS